MNSIVGTALVIGIAVAGGPILADGSPPPPTVLTRVIDLVDEPVALDEAGVNDRWESEPFDTSRFTTIGIRLLADLSGGSGMICVAAWRFEPDETFRESGPVAFAGPYAPYPVPYPASSYPGFGDVRGLSARIVCEPASADPFGGGDASGTITDIKVILSHS